MAAPATHIILAKKVFDKYCPDKNEADFFRGTEFADIRYIANIDRNLTHFQQVSLEEIINADPFTAGLKTHSLVDLTRNQFVHNSGLIDLLPESKFLTQTLKAYEDILLYDQLDSWQKYVEFFNQLSDLELTFTIDREIILDWHKLIQDAIKTKPTEEVLINFITQKLKLPAAEQEIRELFHKLQQIEKIKKITFDYYQNFEQIISEYTN